MMLQSGEKIPMKGRTVTVTPRAFECLPRVRDHLVDVARAGERITYGRLVADLELPYLPRGLGRLLDLLSEDCRRRGEPSLAALVVSDSSREVGADFAGDPAAERAAVYQEWRPVRDSAGRP